MPNSSLPNHDGSDGLPDAAAYRPSPVRTASDALKRIQAFSSATKAGSLICEMLA